VTERSPTALLSAVGKLRFGIVHRRTAASQSANWRTSLLLYFYKE